MSVDDYLCLDSASALLDQRLACPTITYANTSTLCDTDLEHELDMFIESKLSQDNNTMDFLLKCWRVLLSSFVSIEVTEKSKLTYGALRRTFGFCVASNFPLFATHCANTAHVTYENAYAILKRAHDILHYLSKRVDLEQRRSNIVLPNYLFELHLNSNPTPRLSRVIAEAEWLFLLRSWFRWNKPRFVTSSLLTDDHTAITHAIAACCENQSANDEQKNTIATATTVQEPVEITYAIATCCENQSTNDEQKHTIAIATAIQEPVANINNTVTVAQPDSIATEHQKTEMVHDAVVTQYLQTQLDKFRAQQPSLFCGVVDDISGAYSLHSVYGRLNHIERTCENTIVRIRFLLQQLRTSQQKKMSIQENDRFCLVVRVDATTNTILNYDIVQWNQIRNDEHKTHVS